MNKNNEIKEIIIEIIKQLEIDYLRLKINSIKNDDNEAYHMYDFKSNDGIGLLMGSMHSYENLYKEFESIYLVSLNINGELDYLREKKLITENEMWIKEVIIDFLKMLHPYIEQR